MGIVDPGQVQVTLQAGTPIGKYVVRRKLAEGGMAEIYLASARGPGGFEKDVVIKRIRSFLASDPGFVQMFIAEAKLASRLNHANLVQIFDFDQHEDTYYLAMEYVRGHSLQDVRKRAREMLSPMKPTLVAHVAAEVAKGLHCAHRLTDKAGQPLNLVHRDVTPHNVLLSFEGEVKLTDFGVAKAGSQQTSSGVLKGKFAYMSPEQSRGEPVDARTDVFALGIVLWEMLTGGRLFDGDSDVAVLRAVQQSAIAPPARLNPDVPPELDAVVMRALERDPAARFQTAQEMERALAGFVFRHARSLDDTDLGAYLRALFADELSAAAAEGTSSSPRPVDATEAAAPPREPTVAMRKRAPRAEPPPPPPAASTVSTISPDDEGPTLSPDEDAHAATHVVDPDAAPPALARPARGAVSPKAGAGRLWRGVAIGTGVVLVTLGASRLAASRGAAPARPEIAARDGGPVAAAPTVPSTSAPEPKPVEQPKPAPEAVPAASDHEARKAPEVATAGATEHNEPRPPVPEPPKGEPVAAVEPAQNTVAKPTQARGTTVASASSATSRSGHASTKPASGVARSSQGKAARSSEAAGEGLLVLRVTPWAKLSIDGEVKGEVENRGSYHLPVGPHHLVLEHSTGKRVLDVTISLGQTVKREVNFLSDQ